jgi:hypothetical protein
MHLAVLQGIKVILIHFHQESMTGYIRQRKSKIPLSLPKKSLGFIYFTKHLARIKGDISILKSAKAPVHAKLELENIR